MQYNHDAPCRSSADTPSCSSRDTPRSAGSESHTSTTGRNRDSGSAALTAINKLLEDRHARLSPQHAASALALLEELTFRCRALSLLPAVPVSPPNVSPRSSPSASQASPPTSPVLAATAASVSSPSSASTPACPSAGAAASPLLLLLPSDALVRILVSLPTVEDLGRVDCVCSALHLPSLSSASPVEEALRVRASAAGVALPDTLPEGETSWVQKLCWDERRRRFGLPSVVAGGMYHSLIVDAAGRLLTCGDATLDGGRPGLLGHGAHVVRLDSPRPIPSLLHVRIRTLAAAEYHSVALSESGEAYSWGYGALGRLGHADEADRLEPTHIDAAALGGEFITAASAGHCHTLLLSECGAAFACGYGGSGRLGLGAASLREQRVPQALEPVALDILRATPLRAVAAGTHHTLLLSRTGEVLSCGEGGLGQLGHGDDADEWAPRRVATLVGTRCCAIAAGRQHSLALSEGGVVWSWGDGDEGRLGHGDMETRWAPSPIGGALTGRRVCELASVKDHALALTVDGLVYSWGLGLCGQLGHGNEEQSELAPRQVEGLVGTRVVAVAAGTHHCFAVATDGCLFGWGIGQTTEHDHHGLSHAVGTLGLGLERHQCEPLQYAGLRVRRRELTRTIRTTTRAGGESPK